MAAHCGKTASDHDSKRVVFLASYFEHLTLTSTDPTFRDGYLHPKFELDGTHVNVAALGALARTLAMDGRTVFDAVPLA